MLLYSLLLSISRFLEHCIELMSADALPRCSVEMLNEEGRRALVLGISVYIMQQKVTGQPVTFCCIMYTLMPSTRARKSAQNVHVMRRREGVMCRDALLMGSAQHHAKTGGGTVPHQRSSSGDT
jgi:hypothetical protein